MLDGLWTTCIASIWTVQACWTDGPDHWEPWLDEIANNRTISLSLAQARLLAGITVAITGQDLRRGSAKDLKAIRRKAADIGVSDTKVATSLGHTWKSLYKGTTDLYLGPTGREYWSSRLKDAIGERFELNTAIVPYKKWRRSKDEITSKCDETGLESTDALARRQASAQIDKEKLEEWRTRANDSAWGPDLSSAYNPPIMDLPINSNSPIPNLSSDSKLPIRSLPVHMSEQDDTDDRIPVIGILTTVRSLAVTGTLAIPFSIRTLLDPQLLSLGQDIENLITMGSDTSSEEIERLLVDPVVSSLIVDRNDDHATFIKRFAQLNVIRNSYYQHTVPRKTLSTHQRLQQRRANLVSSSLFTYVSQMQLYDD